LAWAQKIIENDPQKKEQRVKEIQPACTLEFNSLAHRPLYTVLNCEKFYNRFGLIPPDWVSTLKIAMGSEGISGEPSSL
jgi:dTDP-4-dehydrorhamnose reductase